MRDSEKIEMLLAITTEIRKENMMMKRCISLIAERIETLGRDQFDNIVDLLEV